MIVLGDIHGAFSHLKYIISSTQEKIIIQVGDFGLGFVSLKRDLENLKELDNTLIMYNKHLYVIRGNHDNPLFFNGSYEDSFKHLHLVEDYTIYNLEGKNILFIGGAISIDRKLRLKDIDYWEDEEFDYDEERLLTTLMLHKDKVDVVITHTAPSFCTPIGFNGLVHHYAAIDNNLLAELTAERTQLDRMHSVICSKCKPSTWIYGHFHGDMKEDIDGTKFILLGIGNTTNL